MVTITYLDASAAVKLIVDEPESEPLSVEIIAGHRRLVSSWLLHTEMHCAVGRHPEVVPAESVSIVLQRVTLADVTRGDLISAGTYRPLRSNDAIHLAVAIRLGADEMVTYDAELAAAARRAGLRVVAPHGERRTD